MLIVKHLSFSYDRKNQVLKDIDFELAPGFTFLVGENGSGKSTLVKATTGILSAKNAEINIGDLQAGSNAFKKKIAYLPQTFDVYPHLKVREILDFVAGLKGVPEKEHRQRLPAISECVDIKSFLDKKLKHCSEGMRRRVGIATTLIGDPEVIVMDEPTAGIDPKERLSFYRMIKTVFSGKTVLISTHILDDVEYLADNILMLSQGRIVFHGKCSAFMKSLYDRVYLITCQADMFFNLEKDYRILSTQKQGNEIRCHVVPKRESETIELEKISATTEDIWLYFEGLNRI